MEKTATKPKGGRDGSKYVEVLENPTPGESGIYRSALVKGKDLLTEVEGVKTLVDLLERSVKKNADRPFVGSRSSLPDGPFVYTTYCDHMARVMHCAHGLAHIGMKAGDKVGVYSSNCEEWMVTEHALYNSSGVVVSLYDTLGPNAAEYILNHADVSIVFCSVASFPKLIAAAQKLEGKVKYVVPFKPVQDLLNAESIGIKVLNFVDLLKLGQENSQSELTRPAPDDLCTIMYTSGTTGEPKGVMITHKNMVAQIAGYCLNIGHTEVEVQPVYVSYLPMAHIMERFSLLNIAFFGGKIGVFSGDVKRLLNDFQDIKPTSIVGAPRVYQRIYDKVMSTIKESGTIKQWLFWTAYNAKKKAIAEGKETPFWDKLVFQPMNKKIFGGNVTYCGSGSAPLSAEVAEFLRICFAPEMEESWGMTETTCGVFFSVRSENMIGSVGYPVPTVELKLVDVPDRNYRVTDKPCPRGELCVRGTSVTKGYYKDPERTAAAFDEAGWLHTGDIGQINEDLSLKIIDRKKNIFKLSIGEYVAPEYLEAVYIRSELVAQCLVYGDGYKNFLVAVVVPDEEVVMAWARAKKIPESFESLCKNPQLKKAILDNMVAVGKLAKLNSFEIIKDVHLDHTLWSLENGIFTPTLKLKRADCQAKYQSEIDAMYKNYKEPTTQ